MTTKMPMTLEEHEELGERLYQIHQDLIHTATRLANAYPKKSDEVKTILKTIANLVHLRSILDQRLHDEYRDQFSVYTYYPIPKDKRVPGR